MVFRVYVEKKPEFASEARALLADANGMLGIQGLEKVRVINRYDAEGVDGELFEYAKRNVFSEPQLDMVSDRVDTEGAAAVFAVEPLPGQFDQRADSAAQCIQIISRKERPLVATAKVYVLYGKVSDKDVESVKRFVINPVECRETDDTLPETLRVEYAVPKEVSTLTGFSTMDEKELQGFVSAYGLAMDADDVRFCRDYFASEHRDPTLTLEKLSCGSRTAGKNGETRQSHGRCHHCRKTASQRGKTAQPRRIGGNQRLYRQNQG